MAAMTAKQLRQLSERIDTHLKRFEADPVINEAKERPGMKGMKLPRYFHAQAYATRQYVYVTYIEFQGQSKLTPDDAAAYLDKLDAGFVGRHQDALR
jgi:hypothetical protein